MASVDNMADAKLYHGDCLDILPTLPDASVDMVFADPPFNIGKRYNGSGKNDRRDDYYEWCEAWIDQCFRLLKDTGTFYLMTIDRHLEKLFPMMGARGQFINQVKWRNVSAAHDKRAYWPSTQPILVYGKTENYTFNTYGERRKIRPENMRWGKYTTEPKGQLLDYWDDIPFVYAGSVSHPEAIIEPGTNRKAHPAQMPVGLPKRAILFSTNPGDVVLDPFAGSGTTGVACHETGRKFIGIEKFDKYITLSEKRISQAQKQLVLPMFG